MLVTIGHEVSDNIGIAYLAFNPRTFLIQVAALRTVFAEVGKRDAFRGLARMMTDPHIWKKVRELSDTLVTRGFGEEFLEDIEGRRVRTKRYAQKQGRLMKGGLLTSSLLKHYHQKVGFMPLRGSDFATAQVAAVLAMTKAERIVKNPHKHQQVLKEYGVTAEPEFNPKKPGYYKYQQQSKDFIRKYVEDVVAGTQVPSGRVHRAPIQRHPAGSWVVKFQNYPMHELNYIISRLSRQHKQWKKGDLSSRTMVNWVFNIGLATWMYSLFFEEMMEAIFGRGLLSPFPRPIKEVSQELQFQQRIAKERGQQGLSAGQMATVGLRLGGELAEPFPLASTLRYGTTPLGPMAEVLSGLSMTAAGKRVKLAGTPLEQLGTMAGFPIRGLSYAMRLQDEEAEKSKVEQIPIGAGRRRRRRRYTIENP
jgi:hypothetical protein